MQTNIIYLDPRKVQMIVYKCYLTLGSKHKQHYILVSPILSRYLANNFEDLKEHESKINLITLL